MENKQSKQKQVVAALADAFARRRDLSQKEVAEKIGISASYLSRILAGNQKNLSIDLLDALCRACNMDLCVAIERGRRLLENLPVEGVPPAPQDQEPHVITLKEIYEEMAKMNELLRRQCPLVAFSRQIGRNEDDPR
jgi:transcriptional regulator with XRE-family HTH domain